MKTPVVGSLAVLVLAGAAFLGWKASKTVPLDPAHPERRDEIGSVEGMVRLPGGRFTMGADDGFPHEGPAHPVEVAAFWLDVEEVTNDQFAAFVAVTGYRTEAERFGWSAVFKPGEGWDRVDGADWRHPEGPSSDLAGRGREPVVQVSWGDAVAFAGWAGKRLPTEAEFEYALRDGGRGVGVYPWGGELVPGKTHRANLWQGPFPAEDRADDGARRAAAVGSFAPGPFGLLDLSGNVWEWCADWYDPGYYRHGPVANPRGPSTGPTIRPGEGPHRVLRGGSFLCSENYCTGYRTSARSSCTPDSATNHMGFRCARPDYANSGPGRTSPSP